MVVCGPPSHVSLLAANLTNICIQMLNPWDVFWAVDCATDLPESVYGETDEDCHRAMDEGFGELLDRKYENCTEWYLTNLSTLGVQEPLIIIIRRDGRWQFDEGGHRLSWALRQNIDLIPFAFDDTGADDDSQLGYMVRRADVIASHTAMDEFLVQPEAEKLFADSAPSVLVAEKKRGEIEFVPQPRRPRRSAGRHS